MNAKKKNKRGDIVFFVQLLTHAYGYIIINIVVVVRGNLDEKYLLIILF